MIRLLTTKVLGFALAGTLAAGAATTVLPAVFAAEHSEGPNHGLLTSEVMQHGTATATDLTPPSSPKNEGEPVRVVAQSDAGKVQGAVNKGPNPAVQAPAGGSERTQNHGFFVSQVARGLSTSIQGIVFPSNAGNHGQRVRAAAHSDVGKAAGK